MPDRKFDTWCLVAVCDVCGSHTLLFRNVPERLSQIGGNYRTTCLVCGRTNSFSVRRIKESKEEVSGMSAAGTLTKQQRERH